MIELLTKIELGCETYWQAIKSLKSQYSQKSISVINEKKLRKIIQHCYSNVKYYKELFDSNGITPEQIRTVKDIRLLPFTTKEDLRSRFWEFFPRQLSACRVSRTSGSTGVPVCILSDINSRKYNSVSVLRTRKAAGIPFLGKTILTPLKHSLEGNKRPHWTYLQGIHKTYYINPYIESTRNQEYAKELIHKLHNPAIIGITSAIKALAYQVHDNACPYFKPRAIITGGETLLPEVKGFIEKVFNQNVIDIYACNEAGEIAWQCPHSSLYHVNAENCIFEILNEKNEPVEEDEVGEVVITNLNRYSMPFIRYKNGDMARASYEQCSCGRKLPVFKEIIGRSGEDFHLPDGKKLQWNVLKSAMNHNLIRQFQLIQNPDASVTVKYIPEDASKTKEIEEVLKERFARLLPSSLSISYEVVQNIPQAPSGKSKLVLCNYQP